MPDPYMFRTAMARVSAAVNIIVTDGEKGLHGMTASAVCSVSDNPPSLLVCINRSSRMHRAVVENGKLSVNVLSASQQRLSDIFADKGLDMAARVAAAKWSDCGHGIPALAGALASFGCSVSACVDAGSHSVFICRVEHMSLGKQDLDGLVYFTRAYHQLLARTAVA